VSAYASAGQLLGTAVIWPVFALAAMIWVAEYLDRYFKKWFDDYVLAFVSFLPLAALLTLGSLASFVQASEAGQILRAKIALGATLVAVAIGFAIRIKGVDEELEPRG
jgi:hypothetical protein